MTDSYPLKNQSEAAPNNNIAAKWISNVDVFFESLIRVIRGTRSRSSSETQGQSVGSGERAGRMFSSTGERAPRYRFSLTYFQKFKRMPAPDWAQKMLCIMVPNRRTLSPEFFWWVRTRRLLSRSRLVWLMHQEMHAVRKLSKSPSDFKILSAWKLKTLFQKYNLSLQQVFTLPSVTSLRKY